MRTTEPVRATAIETTPEGLVLVLGERMNAELSPGGYGIHWPLVDEDLSINGLLRGLD